MVLVDASVWVDYLRGRTTPEVDWLDRNLGARPLGLTDVTLCEVMQGCPDHQEAELAARLLEFSVLRTGGVDLALMAAENYRRLRRRGVTVRKTIDCWIATFCLQHGHTLLHSDRDFAPFERHLGLRVVHHG